MKSAAEIKEEEFRVHPIWQFDAEEEMTLFPVQKLPVDNLKGCVVGLDLRLANGEKVFAVLSNVSLSSKRATEQFLLADIFAGGSHHILARYFDENWHKDGPAALADFLGKRASEVFPITFDLSPFCRSDAWSLSGTIELEPRERLSDAERLDLIFAGM